MIRFYFSTITSFWFSDKLMSKKVNVSIAVL